MASIQKTYNSMGLPMNINRSNPIPIDSTELWYSLADAKNYAKTDPRAYVGQSLKVIDEINNTVSLYIIGDTEGSLIDASGDISILYDTVKEYEPIEITNVSSSTHDLDIKLSSETYTNLSGITVVLTSENGEQTAVSDADGNVTGLHSEPSFTLSLQTDYDTIDILITCTYQLDLNKVIHDYILHVNEDDFDGETGEDGAGIGSIFVDTTLSISGAAADAKVVGDKIDELTSSMNGLTSSVEQSESDIEELKVLVGDTSVSNQIAEAIVEVYVQENEPSDASEGSIWVDTSEDGLSGTPNSTAAKVYVVDAATTDITTVDFSKYAIGDVVLVTTS